MMKATIRLLLVVLTGLWSITGTAQEKKVVTGVVRDTAGNVVPGVTVYEKGTLSSSVTGMDGKFKIQVSSPRSVLVFSSVGFEKKEITVGDQDALTISLQGEITSLEGVVVTALGIKKEQRKVGYATSQ